jgi:hypothetical protein
MTKKCSKKVERSAKYLVTVKDGEVTEAKRKLDVEILGDATVEKSKKSAGTRLALVELLLFAHTESVRVLPFKVILKTLFPLSPKSKASRDMVAKYLSSACDICASGKTEFGEVKLCVPVSQRFLDERMWDYGAKQPSTWQGATDYLAVGGLGTGKSGDNQRTKAFAGVYYPPDYGNMFFHSWFMNRVIFGTISKEDALIRTYRLFQLGETPFSHFQEVVSVYLSKATRIINSTPPKLLSAIAGKIYMDDEEARKLAGAAIPLLESNDVPEQKQLAGTNIIEFSTKRISVDIDGDTEVAE